MRKTPPERRPAARRNGTSRDLAYEAEVSRSYLSQIEKGAFFASLRIVGKLATLLRSSRPTY
jgi:DNA-binding XRE family transcriptional regulator